ncbi:hypothetical protein PUW79_10645 [Microbacterium sp. NE2HP2]|uniref:hypothetical protein n=1 Tax=Microbacterium plantarum TaxID=1816425 RepID=UPI002366BB70|nr:hypothetical protein [Microbacterium plantarum]MDD7945087.1 hypothetical protein [Microbacterium plantarum]
MEHEFRVSDLFLTKAAARRVSADTLRAWRRAGNRIFFDPVDESIPDELIHRDDTIVAASRSALAAYRDRWPHLRVRLVNHHVDPRVYAAMRGALRGSDARVGYFGEVENAVLTPELEERIDVHPVDTSRAEQSWFSRLPDYALHYGVRRRRELDHFKPFLKGFTAAACRANILIQRDDAEAALWLPADYPFWIDSAESSTAIGEAIERAVDSYGSAAWNYGLDVMGELERTTGRAAISRSLEMLFAD